MFQNFEGENCPFPVNHHMLIVLFSDLSSKLIKISEESKELKIPLV